MGKFNAKKIGVCVIDSVDTTKVLLYGNYFKEDLAAGDWTDADIEENLDRFFSGDWGTVSPKVKAANDKHLKEGKGNLTGQYENHKLKRREPMIIFYSEYNDCIYILSQADFDRVEMSWLVPQEKYEKEFTYERIAGAKPNESGVDGREKVRVLPESIKYGEHGHQLKPEQKEAIRQEYPSRGMIAEQLSPEENKEYKRLITTSKRRALKPDEIKILNALNKKIDAAEAEKDAMEVQKEIIHYAGTVHQSEIDATKAAIETGVGANGRQIAGLPNDIVETLHEAAESRGHTYDELIELIAETTQITHKNLPESIKYVLKNIDKPFFFADSKKLKKDSEAMENDMYIEYYNKDYKNFDPKMADEFWNSDTGEVSDDYDDAVRWFNDGYNVIFVHNGEEVIGWEHSYPDTITITNIDRTVENSEILEDYLNDPAYYRAAIYEDVFNELAKHYSKETIERNKIKFMRVITSKLDELEAQHTKDSKIADSKKLKKDSKPEWLDDEAIDEIVYDRAWPVSVKEVAKELVKKGVRSLDSAKSFVRDYVKNNPSERKHFKNEDFEDFTTHTHQGYEVITLYENDEGRLFVIGYRPNTKDYFVGAGYNTSDGIWAQGYYDYKTEKDATDFLYDRYGWQNLEVKYHK